MKVDILFLAKNRLRFTQDAFSTLVRNTDWSAVHKLVIYDDGSEDGTDEYLRDQARRMGAEFHATSLGAPVLAANRFATESTADLVVKLDNDAIVPSDWLGVSLDVLDRNPETEVLGLEERGIPGRPPYHCRTARHVGGLYVARRAIFNRRPLAEASGIYFGWQEWCLARGVVSGWLAPSLAVFLLDRLPVEPWLSLSREYERRGWQRPWPDYSPGRSALWIWWLAEMRVAA